MSLGFISRARASIGALGLGLGGLGSGCAIETTPAVYAEAGGPYFAVETVPADIGLYPHVYYRGSYAYWVGGRWLYPGPHGWVAFRSEPAELYRYRVNYGAWPYYGAPPRYRAPYYGSPGPVYRAPPAARYPSYRAPAYQTPRARPPTYQAPPARPPTYQAPPARPPTYQAPPARPPTYQAPPARPPTYQAPPARRGR